MIKHRHKYFHRKKFDTEVVSVAWCGAEQIIVESDEEEVVANPGWDNRIAWTLKSTTCEECKGAIGLGLLAGNYFDYHD